MLTAASIDSHKLPLSVILYARLTTLMKTIQSIFLTLLLSALMLILPVTSNAHGEGPWNSFMIDNKNDQVEQSIEQVKQVIGDIALERREVTEWPDPQLRQLKVSLTVLKEEVDGMLLHMQQADGISLQLPSTLKDNPQAGRSVTGMHVIEIAMELIDYISDMESQEAFASDLDADGITAYMFDLTDTYLDKMLVYSKLQQTTEKLAAAEAKFNERTASADFRFHLRQWLQNMGFESLAASLAEEPATSTATNPEPAAAASTSQYGGVLNPE